MKKIYLLVSLVFTVNAFAQYTILVNLSDTATGMYPYGSVMQASDGMLYGMITTGGASTYVPNGCGVLFQYNSAASTYTEKVVFSGTSTGCYPYGSLIQASDGMFYGMTQNGGTSMNCIPGCGALFQYNPITSIYTKKLDFTDTTNGGTPWGSLMQASDGMLYGMAYEGGVHGDGVLFQYNPTTSIYTKKLDFDSTTTGSFPYGTLIQASDGMLYGLASNGGVYGFGTLFQYNPVTSVCTKKLDFDTATTGGFPTGSLMQASDGMLYGMTSLGGASNTCTYGCGVLFQYNPTTGVYTKKLDFANDSIHGTNPHGSLIQASNGMLYGMTYYGGVNNYGVIFQYNPNTSLYTKQFDFADTLGVWPWGDLKQASDGMLYGMASYGGGIGWGVLFKFGIPTTGISQISGLNSTISIYPNPNNGSFVIEPNSAVKQTLQVYDVNGKLVLSQTINSKTSIDASSLNEGIYNISLQSNEGVVNKRLVIVR